MVPLKLFKSKKFKIRVGYKSLKNKLRVAFMQLFLIFNVHSILFYLFENISIFDSYWHTYTVMTTVGFGDISAQTVIGKSITMIFAFSLGIWLLANFVSILMDVKGESLRQKKLGNWSWKLKNPIVLIGSPKNDPETYFYNLLTQIRSTSKTEDKDVLIVSTQFKDGLPDSISDLGAVLKNKKSDDKSLYSEDSLKNADIIYLIAKEERNGISNSITYNTLCLLRENGIKSHIIAETTKECDRERFIQAGASAVIRPIRAYPEMVVRAMINENNAMFLENMFSSQGDEPIVFNYQYSGSWKNIIIMCLELDVGTPVGYINKDGTLISNPSANDNVDSKQLQILIKDHSSQKEKEIERKLNSFNKIA